MNSEQQLSMNILSQYMNSVANTQDMYDKENSNNNKHEHDYDRDQDHNHNYDYSGGSGGDGSGGMSEQDFGSSHYHRYLSPSAPSSSLSHRLNSSNSNDRKEKDKHRNDIYRRKIEQRKLYYFLLSNGSTVQSANPEKKKKEQVKERLKKRLERHKSKEEILQNLPTATAKDYESNSIQKKENLSQHEMSAISNNSDIHSKKKKKKKAKTGKKKETKKTKSEHKERNPAEKSDEKQTMETPKKLYDNNDCAELHKLDVHDSLANSDNKDDEEMNLVDSDHSSTCDDLDERAATGDVAMEVESFDNNLYYQSSPDPTSEESTTIRQTLEMNISNRSFKSMKTEEYLTDHESKGLDESKATYDEYDDKDEDNNNDTLITLEKQTIVNGPSKEENITNTNGGSIKKQREKTKEKENTNTNGASSVSTKHKRKKKTKNQNKNQNQNEEHSKEITAKEQTVQEPVETPIQMLPLFLGKEKKLGEFNSNRGFGKTPIEPKKTPISSPFSTSPSTWEPSSVIHNSATNNIYTTVSQEISDAERKRPTKPPISNRVNCTVQIQPITINSIVNDTDIATPKRPSKPPLKPSFQSPIVVNNSHASRPPIPVLNFSRMKNGSQSSNMITPVSSVATTTPNPILTPTPTPTPVSTFTSSIPPLIPIGGASTMSKYPQLPSYPNDSQFLLESLGSLLATTSSSTATATATTPTTNTSIPASNRINPNSYGVSAFPLIPTAMNTFSMQSISTTTSNNSIYNNSDIYTIPDLSTIEQADEWVDFELSSRSYPSSLWTLNMKSLKVHPELSLDKLKVLMRSK